MHPHSRIVPIECSQCCKPLSDFEIENSVNRNIELMPKVKKIKTVDILDDFNESEDSGHTFDESPQEHYEWPQKAIDKTMDMQCTDCINKQK